MTTNPAPRDPQDFSLILGGPLYQLFLRARLVQPPVGLLRRRIIAITLFTWLPLLVLAVLEGNAWSGVIVPFFFDIDEHARFLVAVPLLVAAELLVHQRLALVVRQFTERELIHPDDRHHFERVKSSTMAWRDSVILELLLLVLAITGGYWFWRTRAVLSVSTWYGSAKNNDLTLTGAGIWYAFVSLSIFRFLLLRWYLRLALWWSFLWRTARLRLQLNALHPDRAAGLGFLSLSLSAFLPVMLAHTVLLSGQLANQIWHENAALPQFKVEIVGVLMALAIAVATPLGFFAVPILQATRNAAREYGLLGQRYVTAFRQKWIARGDLRDADLLGAGDIQSLADLANSYAVIRETGAVPFSPKAVLQMMITVALPLAPLILTLVPLDELVERLLQLLV